MYKKSRLIARILAGAWRINPPELEISGAELTAVAPLLLQTGAGALGWRRVQFSDLRESPAALQLRDIYRYQSLRAALRELELQKVILLLRSHGIEYLMVKGWAIARQYLEPGLRPYGDLDLCVNTEQFQRARGLLKEEGRKYQIDLHLGFAKFGNDSWDELYSRSQCSMLEGVSVRTLGAEDHMRLLCFHFLREGAWRPLWLCDVAVALEARGEGFDWDLCLGSNARSREHVACTIALARQLLGADVQGVPAAACAEGRLPGWLLPAVLKEWEVRSMYERHRSPLTSAWRRPLTSLRKLRHHWPGPVEATIHLNTPFNEASRLPYQLGSSALRVIQFLRRATD